MSRLRPSLSRRLLSNGPFRWILGSQVVSLIGDFMYWVALVVHLSDGPDVAGWITAAVVARTLPAALVGPAAGAVADRVDRRRLLVRVDVLLAATFGGMAVSVAMDGPRAVAIGLLTASTVLTAFQRPALVAATSHVVPEGDLATANGLVEGLAQAAWFVGPALGAALVVVLDPFTVLLMDAGTFVASALLISRAGPLGGDSVGIESDSDRSEPLLAAVVAGAHAIRRDAGLLALAAFLPVVLFGFGAEQVLYVLLVEQRLDLGPEGIGVLLAAAGAGGLLFAPLASRLCGSAYLAWVVVAAGIGTATPILLMSLVESTTIAVGLAAAQGAANIVFEIGSITMLQRAVPDGLLGRVYALTDVGCVTAMFLGSVVAPVFVGVFGLTSALASVGLIGIAATLGLAPALVACGHRLEAQRLAVADLVAELASVAELAAFEPGPIERLARAAAVEHVSAGTALITEGEASDDLFVVRRGSFRVLSQGEGGNPVRHVAAVGSGDLVGEVGLLRGMARTATVRAATDAVVVRIPGSVFVGVLADDRALPDALMRSVTGRLARTHPSLAAVGPISQCQGADTSTVAATTDESDGKAEHDVHTTHADASDTPGARRMEQP